MVTVCESLNSINPAPPIEEASFPNLPKFQGVRRPQMDYLGNDDRNQGCVCADNGGQGNGVLALGRVVYR